jgi:cytochrome c oxidase assembly factor CtaG
MNLHPPVPQGDGLGDFLTAWDFPPIPIALLVVSVLLYAVGWRRLKERRQGKGTLPSWRAWSFYGGMGMLALSLLSPLAVYGDDLFFMHMLQHMVMVIIVPVLVWYGAPLVPMMWGLPRDVRRGIGHLFTSGHPVHRFFSFLTHPGIASAAYVSVLGIWHFPALYDEAQGISLVHDIEHLSMLAVGLLWWWPLIHPAGGKRRLGYGWGMVYLLPPMLMMTVVGAVLSFADVPLYSTYELAGGRWGMTVLEDQQLGGIIMWVPTKFMYLGILGALLYLYVTQEERMARLREEQELATELWAEVTGAGQEAQSNGASEHSSSIGWSKE